MKKTIRVSEKLHTKLKVGAAKAGMSIPDYSAMLIEQGLKVNKGDSK